MWFKTTNANKQVPFNYGTEGSGTWWCMMMNDGAANKLGIATYGDDHLYTYAGAFDDLWHWFVVTYDGGVAYKVFLDAVLLGSGNFGSARNTGTTATRVAQEMAGGNYFNGSAAQVTIWNRALTTAEISALWNAGR